MTEAWSQLAARLSGRHAREILVFVAVGLSNTVLTYAAYLGLLQLMQKNLPAERATQLLEKLQQRRAAAGPDAPAASND